jgi:hypothetical protein
MRFKSVVQNYASLQPKVYSGPFCQMDVNSGQLVEKMGKHDFVTGN